VTSDCKKAIIKLHILDNKVLREKRNLKDISIEHSNLSDVYGVKARLNAYKELLPEVIEEVSNSCEIDVSDMYDDIDDRAQDIATEGVGEEESRGMYG
jgi:hypothetical protein